MVDDDLQERLSALEAQPEDGDDWIPCLKMVDPETGEVTMRIGRCE